MAERGLNFMVNNPHFIGEVVTCPHSFMGIISEEQWLQILAYRSLDRSPSYDYRLYTGYLAAIAKKEEQRVQQSSRGET